MINKKSMESWIDHRFPACTGRVHDLGTASCWYERRGKEAVLTLTCTLRWLESNIMLRKQCGVRSVGVVASIQRGCWRSRKGIDALSRRRAPVRGGIPWILPLLSFILFPCFVIAVVVGCVGCDSEGARWIECWLESFVCWGLLNNSELGPLGRFLLLHFLSFLLLLLLNATAPQAKEYPAGNEEEEEYSTADWATDDRDFVAALLVRCLCSFIRVSCSWMSSLYWLCCCCRCGCCCCCRRYRFKFSDECVRPLCRVDVENHGSVRQLNRRCYIIPRYSYQLAIIKPKTQNKKKG